MEILVCSPDNKLTGDLVVAENELVMDLEDLRQHRQCIESGSDNLFILSPHIGLKLTCFSITKTWTSCF